MEKLLEVKALGLKKLGHGRDKEVYFTCYTQLWVVPSMDYYIWSEKNTIKIERWYVTYCGIYNSIEMSAIVSMNESWERERERER